MRQKYPKAQLDYEDDQWRKIADRQETMQRTGIIILIITIIAAVLFFIKH